MIKALLIAGLTLAVSVPALAQDTQSIVVNYSDLNVASPAGRSVLEHRIAAAADTVCGRGDAGTLEQRMAANSCYKTAHDNAHKRLADLGTRQTVAIAAR